MSENPPLPKIVQVIQNLITILQNEGWTYGLDYIPNRGYCIAGGLLKACGGKYVLKDKNWYEIESFLDIDNNTLFEAADLIANTIGLSHRMDIPKWNDEGGRTKEQVIDVLMASIVKHYNAQFV